jgi:mRNA interferase MazF
VGYRGVTGIRPGQVWWSDLDPAEGREQAGRRPVVVVSSRFHLSLTGEHLVTVLPLTSRERPGWLHRVAVTRPGRTTSYVLTEQVRTIARSRLTGQAPAWVLSDQEAEQVRTVLRKMIDI